jgi:2-hydroxy-3-oxopropionate reductase
MRVGFIGLGIMGKPMAANLIKGGHELFLYSLPEVPAGLVSAGGKACSGAREVAQRADVVITMVPDTPDVQKVLFDAEGVEQGLSAGKVVMDMSSISPIATKEFARQVNELGCEYIDAPGLRRGTRGAKCNVVNHGTGVPKRLSPGSSRSST